MLSTPKLTRSSAAESTPAAAPPRSLLDPDRSFDLDLDDDDDDDDLPPPLEDASAELASKRAEAAHLKHAVRARLEQEKIRKANRKVDATTLLMDRLGAAPVAGESAQAKPKPMTTTSAGGLAGMRRGFLNRSSNSGNKNKAATGNKDVMPSVSVRNSDQAKADPLVFSDVQAALKEAAMGQMDPNLYVTPSLLGSIDSDAHLRAIFDDPGFAEFLAIVEKDPAAAQKKYDPRTNPKAGKYWKGMQRVTGLMGKEIEANASASSRSSSSQADKQQQQPQQKKEVERPKIEELDDDQVPKLMSQPAMSAITPISTRSIKPTPSPPAVTNPSHDDLPAHEHALIERVQGDVRVREALMDPQVQRFLDGMRRGGGGVELGQFMAQASRNPSLMAKVQVLMEVGLLQVQT